MKKFETSTNIVSIIDVGTYDSRLSWDGMFEWQAAEYRKEGYFVCDDYDFEKFKEAIVKACNNLFANECAHGDMLQKYGVKSIVATNMGSPRFYNFQTDWLDLEVEVEDDFIDRAEKTIMAPENKELVSQFIKENWRTRDGYISSMPAEYYSDLPEVFRMIRDDDCGIDDMRAFGTVMMLLFVIEGHVEDGNLVWGEQYWTDRMIDDLQSNTSIGDFCTVLDRDEAIKLYGDHLFYDAIDKAEKRLEEDLEKYAESGVPTAAVQKGKEYIDELAKKIDAYRDKMREAVESHHPRNPDAVREALDDLKDKWEEEFGKCPTRRDQERARWPERFKETELI